MLWAGVSKGCGFCGDHEVAHACPWHFASIPKTKCLMCKDTLAELTQVLCIWTDFNELV